MKIGNERDERAWVAFAASYHTNEYSTNLSRAYSAAAYADALLEELQKRRNEATPPYRDEHRDET